MSTLVSRGADKNARDEVPAVRKKEKMKWIKYWSDKIHSFDRKTAAKILLINDDENQRDSIRVILKSCNSCTVEATDCVNALLMLAQEKFDLIVLDITHPDKSGFRILEFLKQNQIVSKVMITTGTTGVANIISSALPETGRHFTKPYNPDDLLKSVEHILSERSETNLKLQIIKAGDFIKSNPTGDLDMNSSKQGFAEIATTGTDLKDYTVLIDLRDVKSHLSLADIHELATELILYGKTFRRKTAVLVRHTEDMNQAKVFENAAHHEGFNVKAFTVFEDAIIWLSSVSQIEENQ